VYDFETGNEKFTLSGHTWPVRGCAISKDSSLIISVAEDALIVWDARTGQDLDCFESPGFACSACTKDGGIVVVSFHIVLLDILSGEESFVMITDDMLHDCAVTPDGSMILTAGTDQHLILWDVYNEEPIATLKPADQTNLKPGDDVFACAISPDGTFMVSGGSDKMLRIWDMETFKEKHVLRDHNNWITGCAISPDSPMIVSSSWDNTLKIWDASTGKLQETLEGHTGTVNDCTFSPCGKYILSASDDMTLKVWDVSNLIPHP
jgi:WD40 repeat protein